MAGRTTFIIARVFNAHRRPDSVINRGKLVASGTHRQLIAESGIYADIYHRQLRQDLRDGGVRPLAYPGGGHGPFRMS